MTQRIYENIPVVALRGLVVLPGELLHFDAGREKSVNALREAMRRDDLTFLSAQRGRPQGGNYPGGYFRDRHPLQAPADAHPAWG